MPIGSSSELPAPKVGGGDGALGQVLHVDRAEPAEYLHRDASQRHGDQRADDGGVCRHPERDQELHADDGAEHAEHGQQDQGRRLEDARVPRAAGEVLGAVHDLFRGE